MRLVEGTPVAGVTLDRLLCQRPAIMTRMSRTSKISRLSTAARAVLLEMTRKQATVGRLSWHRRSQLTRAKTQPCLIRECGLLLTVMAILPMAKGRARHRRQPSQLGRSKLRSALLLPSVPPLC